MQIKQKRVHAISLAMLYVAGLFVFVVGCLRLFTFSVNAATAPAIITYQGKILANALPATTTLPMRFVIYNAATNGSALYTAAGTTGAPTTINVTPINGIFTVDIGGVGTNTLDPSIMQNNQNVYLEVTINGETLSPRKQLSASPFAFNSLYLGGVAATSTASSSTYIPISDAQGNFNFNMITSTGIIATGSSTLATTTISHLTVIDDATAQGVRDGLGWFMNQRYSNQITMGLNGGGFGAGVTGGNTALTSSIFTYIDTNQISDSASVNQVAFDGRYFYSMLFGIVTRHDTTAPFNATSSWKRVDVTNVVSSSLLTDGSVFDGRYIYFPVSTNINTVLPKGVIYRYDTRSALEATSSWASFDVQTVDASAGGFRGGVFDGRYIYFMPFWSGAGPIDGLTATRYDTRQALNSPSAWSTFRLDSLPGGSINGSHGQGIFDGRYVYYPPSSGALRFVRYDTNKTFSSLAAWESVGMAPGGIGISTSTEYWGGTYDGRYIYLTPNVDTQGKPRGDVIRYDPMYSFVDPRGYNIFDTKAVNPSSSRFYGGAVFDGKYLYFDSTDQDSGVLTRYDVSQPFLATSSWTFFDTHTVNPLAEGFFTLGYDGHSVYLLGGYNAALKFPGYGGDLDTPNSLARLARGSDLFITASSTVLIGTTTSPSTAYQLYVDSGTSTRPGIGVNGYIKASGFITGTTTLDLAEVYPLSTACQQSNSCPVNAEAVCLSGEGGARIERCDAPYSAKAIGVVSTDPGFTLGGLGDDTSRKVALAGRVPLRVTAQNGAIVPGDRLTSSDIPGVAMKATRPGPTLGIALDTYEKSEVGTIIVFVKTEWWGEAVGANNPVNEESTVSTIVNSVVTVTSGSLAQILSNFGIGLAQNVIKVVALVAEKITTNELCIGSTCITESDLQRLLGTVSVGNIISSTPVVMPTNLPAVIGDTTSSTNETISVISDQIASSSLELPHSAPRPDETSPSGPQPDNASPSADSSADANSPARVP